MSILEGIAFTAILAVVLFPIVMQYVKVDREITAEEEERKAHAKYHRELAYWQDRAIRARTEIKVLDGKTFTIENRRV